MKRKPDALTVEKEGEDSDSEKELHGEVESVADL